MYGSSVVSGGLPYLRNSRKEGPGGGCVGVSAHNRGHPPATHDSHGAWGQPELTSATALLALLPAAISLQRQIDSNDPGVKRNKFFRFNIRGDDDHGEIARVFARRPTR